MHGASRGKLEDPHTSTERGTCQRAVDLAAAQELAFRQDAHLEDELTRLGFGAAVKKLSVADQADPLMALLCHDRDLPCGEGGRCITKKEVMQLKGETDR